MLNDTIFIGAFRYYLGRQTYAVTDFCLYVENNLGNISESTRRLMRRELREEIERDDEARAVSETRFLPLGSNCDREMWIELYERLKEYDNVLY